MINSKQLELKLIKKSRWEIEDAYECIEKYKLTPVQLVGKVHFSEFWHFKLKDIYNGFVLFRYNMDFFNKEIID